MKLKITKLNPQDFELAKQMFIFFQIDDDIKNPTSASDKYLKNLLGRDDFHVVAALAGKKILGGFTAYELPKYKSEENEMFLYEIVVDEDHRRKGIATKLIDYLKEICLEKGIKEMFLATEPDNKPAKKLYRSTGGIFEKSAIFSYEIG